jgi:hypothetical protein
MSGGAMDDLGSTLDKISAAYDEGNYRLCMQLCSDAFVAYKTALSESAKLVLSQFIDRCSERLSDGGSTGHNVEPSCSFCGKTPPSVRLGAGPSAFICNECVELFSGALK